MNVFFLDLNVKSKNV